MALVRREIGRRLLNRYLRRSANRGSQLIATRWGRQIGFVYVGGFPKSGTTWISQLVAQYLGLPMIDHTLSWLPLGVSCVLHQHWGYSPELDREIYVIRDGRDVMVSLYMNLMKRLVTFREKRAAFGGLNRVERALLDRLEWAVVHERRFEQILGPSFEPWDAMANMPRFIEAELSSPFLPAVTRPWHQHVNEWRSRGKKTVFVRYEDMLADPNSTLTRVIAQHRDCEVDPELVALAVDRWAFERQTGRSRGTEDRTKFARKGIAGDWQNYFSSDARRAFHAVAGDALIELGYEKDDSWLRDAA